MISLRIWNFLFIYLYGRKTGRNCSKLGSNFQIKSAKVIFSYENPYIFYNINLYSAEVISTLIWTHMYHFFRTNISWSCVSLSMLQDQYQLVFHINCVTPSTVIILYTGYNYPIVRNHYSTTMVSIIG